MLLFFCLEEQFTRSVAFGQFFFLQEGKTFILQHRQERLARDARELAAIAARAEPAALLGAQVQVAGELGVVGAVVHDQRPVFLGSHLHQLEGDLAAPDRGDIAQAADVHVLAFVVADVVGVQVQLGAVDEGDAGVQDGGLLLLELLVEIRGHGGLDGDGGDVLRRDLHVGDDLVRTVGAAQVEAQLVQAGLAQRAERFLRCQQTVGVHVLVDARVCKLADDAVVLLDLHEGLQVHIAHAGDRSPAGRLPLDGEQEVDVLLPELGAADLPHALADGRNLVELAVVIAELALDVALVGLADGGKAGSGQAGAAALGELLPIADEIRAAGDGLQTRIAAVVNIVNRDTILRYIVPYAVHCTQQRWVEWLHLVVVDDGRIPLVINLVGIEIVGDDSGRSVLAVSGTKSIVDVAVSV